MFIYQRAIELSSARYTWIIPGYRAITAVFWGELQPFPDHVYFQLYHCHNSFYHKNPSASCKVRPRILGDFGFLPCFFPWFDWCPMLFLWFSYGFPMIFLLNHHFPMVFLWFPYGIPIGFPIGFHQRQSSSAVALSEAWGPCQARRTTRTKAWPWGDLTMQKNTTTPMSGESLGYGIWYIYIFHIPIGSMVLEYLPTNWDYFKLL